ncbi:DUF547 domain-containing protein [Haloferax sp. S1W]|uniref:DUF547 domain-containing protein n=1 Tax=Haloferax sp. S1W TaxID=3377110 RepID=UPI0037C66C66
MSARPDHPQHENALELASDYLQRVRFGDETSEVRDALAALDSDALASELDSDAHRRAFWLNIYNAAVQDALSSEPSKYDSRYRFFRASVVTVAGESLSPDDIEHGILRRSMLGWGFGYIPNPFPGSFERTHRVSQLDPRIHFALNCGAASCPPIATYHHDRLSEQLDVATASSLEQKVEYDFDADRARVPRLFLWFRGDFGGRSGIREMLCEYGIIPEDASPSLSYADYDWSLSLGEFTTWP